MSICRHVLGGGGVQPPTHRQFQPCIRLFSFAEGLLCYHFSVATEPWGQTDVWRSRHSVGWSARRHHWPRTAVGPARCFDATQSSRLWNRRLLRGLWEPNTVQKFLLIIVQRSNTNVRLKSHFNRLNSIHDPVNPLMLTVAIWVQL